MTADGDGPTDGDGPPTTAPQTVRVPPAARGWRRSSGRPSAYP